ncbi:MAG: RNA methyltransferase, partial [Candidatus Sumerlaeota bacterium]|nr:RNA methyltransferase [Candidatus Sumerlaeota bacterium]
MNDIQSPVFAVLVHYPIMDKHDRIVSTSITNLDIHDIARAARTFGVRRYYLVTPIEAQQWLARKIISHWEEGWGADYNPNR